MNSYVFNSWEIVPLIILSGHKVDENMTHDNCIQGPTWEKHERKKEKTKEGLLFTKIYHISVLYDGVYI